MSPVTAALALHRFGLGARPGELASIQGDPRGWLMDQLSGPDDWHDLDALPDSSERIKTSFGMMQATPIDKAAEGQRQREAMVAELRARTRAFAGSAQPFRVRWLLAWSNHFSVSARHPLVRSNAPVFERTAIRPHCTGSFETMLQATARHPVMLAYLDNVSSIGPDSLAGWATGRGSNENYARELLELHTLGVDGGYTQSDVESLAMILTGWTYVDRKRTTDGTFRFESKRHQPGPKVLLGQTFQESGEQEGVLALGLLTRHPATARHVATRLVRHFLSDTPPPTVIDAVARAFHASEGDLQETARALVQHDDSWHPDLAKLRTPQELVLATGRALPSHLAETDLLHAMRQLGQLPFEKDSPAGWSDHSPDWAGPAAIMGRLSWIGTIARRLRKSPISASDLARSVLGPLLTQATIDLIDHAANPEQALGLLLASPEFQRR